MDAPGLVGHLGDPQVHDGAGGAQRGGLVHPEDCCSQLTMASSASPMAALRSALKPNVIRPAGVSA